MGGTWLKKTNEWSGRINTLQIHFISIKHEHVLASVRLGRKKESTNFGSIVSLQGHFKYKMEGFSKEKESFPFAVRKT